MKYLPVALLLLALAACAEDTSSKQSAAGDAVIPEQQTDPIQDQLGTVHFPVSCSEAASRYMERGLALLHHMMYVGAERAFTAATDTDAECAMGYWGQAMTYFHPLWADVISEERLLRGRALVTEAKARGQKTDREQAYIAALEAYYEDGPNQDKRTRLARFSQGWRQVYEQFPDDLEAASLYALALMATASPADKSYQKQKEAGAIVENVLAEIPDHPGAHHYIIHAYDSPPHAERALDVARNYGQIAPEISHALHMPSHIFTRLGLWQESIAWNKRAAVAGLNMSDPRAAKKYYLHAAEYLVYGYLQGAEDQKARQILDSTRALEAPFLGMTSDAYALAAIPARYALERRQWDEAARLQARQPSSFPWDAWSAPFEAITHFARALGGARSGDVGTARAALDALRSLQDQVSQSGNAYWAKQVEIQHKSALAWLVYAEGKEEEALEMMQVAAALEASTEKHPVTPGEVVPARELLGDMLLEMQRPQEALVAYEAALARSPNRFNSLYGAGRSAELGEDKQKAADYYRKLVEVSTQADTERERLLHARTFLAAT